MTSLYQRGSAFERWIQDHLEQHGWLVCRSAGSRSRYDLMALPVAYRDRKPVLIQCKMHDTGTTAERSSLLILASEFGADAVWAYRLKNGKKELRFKLLKSLTAEPWSP